MCTGIALARGEFPEVLIERYGLESRIAQRTREAEPEVRFLWIERTPALPVWHEGQLQIVMWGNRSRSNAVPLSAWCPREDFDAGLWAGLRPVEVRIPATYGLAGGIWFQIREGLRGVLIADRERTPRVYMLTEPASHYFEIMTRSDRAPVMVGERI